MPLARTKKDMKPKRRLLCLKKYNFLSRTKGKKLQKKSLKKITEAHVDPSSSSSSSSSTISCNQVQPSRTILVFYVEFDWVTAQPVLSTMTRFFYTRYIYGFRLSRHLKETKDHNFSMIKIHSKTRPSKCQPYFKSPWLASPGYWYVSIISIQVQ